MLAGPVDAAEAEEFFDGVLDAQMRELNTAGAVVTLVRGDELLLAKGYGYADVENDIPVDAESTLFRICSVSKLFIWTAVMQLVEEGRLDLNADLNNYLDGIEIPATFEQPVTMAHLMTHTPGFEDRMLGILMRSDEEMPSLREVLIEQMPARIWPPGERPAYSNHGSTLAALVVETVAGEPYDNYIMRRIVEPLGMEDTTPDQRLEGQPAQLLTKGYLLVGDAREEFPSPFTVLPPAGSIASTATDMAKFMTAHLQDGRLGDERILEAATARRMRSPLIELDPAVNSPPHGFVDVSSHGVRVLGHFGSSQAFKAMLVILPDHDLGLFTAYNTTTSEEAVIELLDAFLDQYFGPPERPSAPRTITAERAAAYTGEYRSTQMPHSTLLRLNAFIARANVSLSEEGELVALGRRFIGTDDPRVFTERDGSSSLVFVEGEDGRMSHYYDARFSTEAFERVPSSEGRGLHSLIFFFSLFAFLATALALPVGWVKRRWFGAGSKPRIPRALRLALWVASSLLLTSVFALVLLGADAMRLVYGELGAIKTALVLPLIAIVPAGVALFAVPKIWRKGLGTPFGRTCYTATVLLMVLFYWFLNTWNLLGIKT